MLNKLFPLFSILCISLTARCSNFTGFGGLFEELDQSWANADGSALVTLSLNNNDTGIPDFVFTPNPYFDPGDPDSIVADYNKPLGAGGYGKIDKLHPMFFFL